ncbi:hypothetical protein AOLI_G00276160 [Acnodon oligacanthus]
MITMLLHTAVKCVTRLSRAFDARREAERGEWWSQDVRLYGERGMVGVRCKARRHKVGASTQNCTDSLKASTRWFGGRLQFPALQYRSSSIMNSTPMRVSEHPGYENHKNSTTVPPTCRDVPCIFYAAVNVIIFILGIAGNGLVIWIAGFKVKKSINATWYLSLAVCDFIFCSLLPLGIVDGIMDNWIFGLFMCKFLFFIMYVIWFSSIFLLVIISLDRCVIVMFPVWAQNKRTIRKASVIVVLAWIISAALSLPTVIFADVSYYNLTHTTICYANYKNDQQKVADVVCRFVFGFTIPYLIIIICYVVIIRKLKSKQTMTSKKPFKIMVMLTVTFLICWLPYNTFALMELDYEKYKSFYESGLRVAILLANASSCLNPLLYAFMGKDFKDQCHALLSKIENAMAEEEYQKKVQGTVLTTSGESKLSSAV